jgi:hypothetical protein
MQSVEMTSPQTAYVKGRNAVVIEEVNWKGRNHNGKYKYKDEKVRAHTVPLRCTRDRRILRRNVPRRGEERRGNRVSMRPSGVSTYISAVFASKCRWLGRLMAPDARGDDAETEAAEDVSFLG